MYSAEFWKAFNTRSELNTDTVRRIATDRYVYQISDTDNPQLNKVTYISHGDLEQIFSELYQIFSDKENGFEVGVRGTDHPQLHQYLLDHGYKPTVRSENRILKLSPEIMGDLEHRANLKYELRKLSEEDMNGQDIFELLKLCFPDQIVTLERHRSVNQTMYAQAEKISAELRNYALYEGEIPVAYGSLFDMGTFREKHVAVLSGAATHPSYRRQGLYTTMLYLRCRDALEQGVEVLLIQADVETSSPIVAKYGFELVETLTEYIITRR